MATQRTKLRVVVFICLGVLLFALGCILPNRTVYPNSLAPVRSLRITVEMSQREVFFDQLQKFPDKHTFEFTLSDYGTTDHFLAEIWGENISTTASDVPGTSKFVTTSIYWLNFGTPVDDEMIGELLRAYP